MRAAPAARRRAVVVFLVLSVLQWAPWVLLGWLPEVVAWPLGVALFAAAVTFWATGARRRRERSWGLRPGPRSPRDAAVAVGMGLAVYAAVTSGRWLSGALVVEGVAAPGAVAASVVVGLGVAGYQATSEEVVFRGALLAALPARWSHARLAVVSAMVFVAYHAPRWPELVAGPYAVALLLAGLAFAVAALRTGSVWLGAGVHAGWNLGAHLALEADEPVLRLAEPMTAGWTEAAGWWGVVGNGVLLVAVLVWTRRSAVAVRPAGRVAPDGSESPGTPPHLVGRAGPGTQSCA